MEWGWDDVVCWIDQLTTRFENVSQAPQAYSAIAGGGEGGGGGGSPPIGWPPPATAQAGGVGGGNCDVKEEQMDKKQRRLMLNRKAAQEVRRGFMWVRQTYVCGPCLSRRPTLDRFGRSSRRSDRARQWSELTQFLNPLPVRSTQKNISPHACTHPTEPAPQEGQGAAARAAARGDEGGECGAGGRERGDAAGACCVDGGVVCCVLCSIMCSISCVGLERIHNKSAMI